MDQRKVLRLRFAETAGRAECFMSESTNGMAAPGCQGYGGLEGGRGGGAWAPGRGLGGAYMNGRPAERGVWGSVAAGRAGRRPRGPSRGERANGGAEDPIHSLARSMGRSRVNAF